VEDDDMIVEVGWTVRTGRVSPMVNMSDFESGKAWVTRALFEAE
jgi:hypothetical protein